MKTNFQISERTVFRWLGSHQLLLASASHEDILYLAERAPGINNFGPREIANVLKRLPPPTAYENKEIWPVDVREALGQNKRAQIEGRMTLSVDDGKKQFITTGIKMLRESKFEAQLDELAWLRETIGMIMEGRKLDGKLTAERIPIPNGFMPKRGRPKKERVDRPRAHDGDNHLP